MNFYTSSPSSNIMIKSFACFGDNPASKSLSVINTNAFAIYYTPQSIIIDEYILIHEMAPFFP